MILGRRSAPCLLAGAAALPAASRIARAQIRTMGWNVRELPLVGVEVGRARVAGGFGEFLQAVFGRAA